MLAEQIPAIANDLLHDKRLMLVAGTVVNATLIAAPTPTKSHGGKRDPAMYQTSMGNQLHTGL